MDGATFYAYVLRKFIRTDKSTEVYEATTDTIANMLIKFKSDDFKEEAYITGISAVGDYQIALPSDFGHLIGNVSVIDTSDDNAYCEMNKISKQTYDEKYADRLLTRQIISFRLTIQQNRRQRLLLIQWLYRSRRGIAIVLFCVTACFLSYTTG